MHLSTTSWMQIERLIEGNNMQTQTDSTLIAVRNEKGQLVGVMERLNKGFEVYVTKEASVKEVEMLFTFKNKEQLPE